MNTLNQLSNLADIFLLNRKIYIQQYIALTVMQTLQCTVRVKKIPPLRFSDIFYQMVGNF